MAFRRWGAALELDKSSAWTVGCETMIYVSEGQALRKFFEVSNTSELAWICLDDGACEVDGNLRCQLALIPTKVKMMRTLRWRGGGMVRYP
jgi:hypothetical protein